MQAFDSAYEQLAGHFRRIGQLGEIEAVVEWDQAVNMPAAAGPARAAAVANLAFMRHELLVQPRVADWIENAKAQRDLGTWELANLQEAERLFLRARAIPAALVEASAVADKTCEQAWRRYRGENNFTDFAPYLEKVVALKREVAQALADTLGVDPYDALVDEYEPGASRATIDSVFVPLREFLPSFAEEVIERQRGTKIVQPTGPFSVPDQRALGLRLMAASGFDTNRGRLDVSHHPFCGGVPGDVRITTRYDEQDFTSGLMGVLHEAGHGKYEQGLPQQWEHQPVGAARGMVLHESQSLLQEMQVCRSPEFLEFAAPLFRRAFAVRAESEPAAFSLANLQALYLRVKPSLIRVDADEVTYPAHVILRYEIERDLIDGSLCVSELPEVWDAGMKSLLGLNTAGDDKNGCMQDVHWPSGAFGYFPLYTLGAVAAAQLYSSAKAASPQIPEAIRQGDFAPLNAWLAANVWSRASSVSTQQLLVDATGSELAPTCFIEHLKNRYLGS